MTLHGRNTPASVCAYIDAVWADHEPPDPIALARELGYSPKGIRRLLEKHGENLPRYLERRKRMVTEQPRFMARQHGAWKPEQYVDTPHGAIDDVEAVDDQTLVDLTAEARRRATETTSDVLAAAAEIRIVIRERVQSHRPVQRDAYLLLSRLDALERNLQRRHAA